MSPTTDPPPRPHGLWRRRRPLHRGLVLLTVLLVVGAATVLLTTVSRGAPSGATPGADDDGSSTVEARRHDLVARMQLSGTLGLVGGEDVVVPTGTDAAALRQAQDAVDEAVATVRADRTSLVGTRRSGDRDVAASRGTVMAARHGVNAARRARVTACAASAASPDCVQADKELITARDQVTQARNALAAARAQASAAENQAASALETSTAHLASVRATLSDARSRATSPRTTYTAVAPLGTAVGRGERLYALDRTAVPLFYGTVVPWRALYRGVSAGPDVKVLNENLAALGYDAGLAGVRRFTARTERAVKAWQQDMHAPATGLVALGDVVVRPGAVVITAVTARAGQAATPGSVVLTASSTAREVSVRLAAAQQGQVSTGDAVTVTLPDGSTADGRVASVGTVASAAPADGAADGADGAAAASLPVTITLDEPDAGQGLDQAPVLVGITTASVEDALVVPVNALVALAGGGYAVEVVDDEGDHRLVAVEFGLFDDAEGLVQVTGTELQAGQRVVVPGS